MARVALLSTDNLEEFFVYDELLVEPLAQRGWQAETVSWRDESVDWSVYDLVIVRSTWDYQQHPDAFVRKLTHIDKQTRLENPLSLLLWNIDKKYLKSLAINGVPLIPTYWGETFDYQVLLESFDTFCAPGLVIKPTVSANADDTFWLTPANCADHKILLEKTFAQRPHMIQPFVSAVTEEGEYSLFYFGGELSHVIIKTPKKHDFRVQEEHGGQLKLVDATPRMQQVGEQTLKALPTESLYARIDIVRFKDDWAVMEVELIEPSLYFNLDGTSPQRFAEAMTHYLKRT
ncbi:ATP-grasp domain-containing protein [Alteromonas lipotrueiana]|uniref:ATP-grasp domain-containing protein n=1 Tax=Alteromonas lipotrueiana TaxID=2803815 RepID=UPI001C48E8CE|nr:hypothetical protein [Alteromonas lipotrueiana]